MSKTTAQRVAEEVAANMARGLPVTRFTAVIELRANSHAELEMLVHALGNNWHHHYSQYHEALERDSTDGKTSVFFTETNPGQTPEKYHDQLMAWTYPDAETRAAVEALLRPGPMKRTELYTELVGMSNSLDEATTPESVAEVLRELAKQIEDAGFANG